FVKVHLPVTALLPVKKDDAIFNFVSAFAESVDRFEFAAGFCYEVVDQQHPRTALKCPSIGNVPDMPYFVTFIFIERESGHVLLIVAKHELLQFFGKWISGA